MPRSGSGHQLWYAHHLNENSNDKDLNAARSAALFDGHGLWKIPLQSLMFPVLWSL